MINLTYPQAIEKVTHLIALDKTEIYLRDDNGFPYDKVETVKSGNSYRLSGPASCYLIFSEAGLTFRLNVDFEPRSANGASVALFDRDRLRELMAKLSPKARCQFANMLENEVLAGLQKRTDELRAAMRSQADSEDCVRGLIVAAMAEHSQ